MHRHRQLLPCRTIPIPLFLRATADPLACVLAAEPCAFHMLSKAEPGHDSWAKADLTM